MTLEPGIDWGESGQVPEDAIWVDTDAAARELVVAARRANQPLPRLCLTGGDVARGLGGGRGSDRLRSGHATHARIDIGAALLDGRIDWFIAHLVARRSWISGRIVVIANTDFLGKWNIAPRAHPGDGLLDLVDGNPRFGDRLEARRRLPSGGHVPHPSIKTRRSTSFQLEFDHPTTIRLDGRSVGKSRMLSVRCEPESLDVWI